MQELSQFLDGMDIYNVASVMELFHVPNIPVAFKRPRFECGMWDLGRMSSLGSENSRFTVMAVHCTAALLLASLLNCNSEGVFHNNMSSNAACNIMGAICQHAPKCATFGDGSTIHIRNFAFSSSAQSETVVKVSDTFPREYFLRPEYDVNMVKKFSVGYLRGRYKTYAFEDLVHLSSVISFMEKMKMHVDTDMCHLPIQVLRPDFDLVLGRAYPLFQCAGNGSNLRGSVRMCAADDFETNIRMDGSHFIGSVSKAELLQTLWQQNLIVYALVHRRNALLFNGFQYGVILPIGYVDNQEQTERSYFDGNTLCYRVRWADDSTTDECYMDVENYLVPLAAPLSVSLSSSSLLRIAGGACMSGFVRCNLFYPNGYLVFDNKFESVYISLPRGSICGVFSVSLKDLEVRHSE